MSLLAKIATDIREIKQTQQQLAMQQSTEMSPNKENFYLKYKLDLPFKVLESFKDFEKNFDNAEFRRDFSYAINALVDREMVLTKSITNILKKFFSRELMVSFTCSRQMHDKHVIKDFEFTRCVFGKNLFFIFN